MKKSKRAIEATSKSEKESKKIDLKGAKEAAGKTARAVGSAAKQAAANTADAAAHAAAATSETASKVAEKTSMLAQDAVGKMSDTAVTVAGKATGIASSAAVQTVGTVSRAGESLHNIMDVNNDGVVDAEDIVIIALKTPGVRVTRGAFLRKEFKKRYPKETVDAAILKTPALAGISAEDVDKVADAVIKYERNCVSGISAALGAPGGAAMLATIPADIAQYYGYMMRTAQKLMYLYGFPEIDDEDQNEGLDSETMNTLILCLGVMYGVAGANNAIKAMAKALGTGVEKKLMDAALTKGTIYPIVKSVSKWFGIRMNKEVFSGFFGKAIPVAGGIVGGGLTYLTFKPCCEKLKFALQDTYLSNPQHISSEEEEAIFDAIDAEEWREISDEV